MRHLFKSVYILVALFAVAVDLGQILIFLIQSLSDHDPHEHPAFDTLAVMAQYALFALNALSLKYFFNKAHFTQYARKIFRHEYTYLFLVIFVIRFTDLFHRAKGLGDYTVALLYLLGVLLKHGTRLILLQLICFYRFRRLPGDPSDNEEDAPINAADDDAQPAAAPVDLLPTWKFLLYISPNLFDVCANLIRLTLLYVYVLSTADEVAMTKSSALVFVGEMLYFYYNTLLISAFLLKVKNPTKDVLRFRHKQAQVDLKQRDDPLL